MKHQNKPHFSRKNRLRWRRIVFVLLLLGGVATWLIVNPNSYQSAPATETTSAEPLGETASSDGTLSTDQNATSDDGTLLASAVLARLEVKDRASKAGYARTEFYDDWPTIDGCSLRQKIIKREFGDTAVLSDGCTVIAGEYDEPYTGEHKVFRQKSEISKGIQIDHAVALSNAWQTGAQNLTKDERYNLATDPLNLLAVDASANMTKSDSDAASWLPDNQNFRCSYVARQVSVKFKYKLWVTQSERDAIAKVLLTCPEQKSIGISE